MNEQERERLAKLFGRLGSDQAGERQNALEAIEKSLSAAGLSWAWVCDLVNQAPFVREDDLKRRDRLLTRLVHDRLVECKAQDWALSAGERAAVRRLFSQTDLVKSLRNIGPEEIESAIFVADEMRRRVGAR